MPRVQHIKSTVHNLFRARAIGLELEPDRRLDLQVALRRLPTGACFSGLTAAWLHGLESFGGSPVEVTVPLDAGVSVRSGMTVHRCKLAQSEISRAAGLPSTSVLRTLLDVSRQQRLLQAVQVADAAFHKGLATPAQVAAYLELSGGRHGVKKLRRVLSLADGRAESPAETHIRLILVLFGLPAPELQYDLFDSEGRFIGRADLYYPEARLVIEYDGSYHRDNWPADLRRQNLLLSAGYGLLRFSAPDLHRPVSVAAQVAANLGVQARMSAQIAI